MEEKKGKVFTLKEEELKSVNGGLIVDNGDGQKFWLVREDGTVISPVPGKEKAQDFAKAYGLSTRILTKEEYRLRFGRELNW